MGNIVNNKFNFNGLSNLDLVVLQHKCRKYPEDGWLVKAVAIEMSRRVKSRQETHTKVRDHIK